MGSNGASASCASAVAAPALQAGQGDAVSFARHFIANPDLVERLRGELVAIQHDLFDLGGEICIPGYQLIKEEHVLRLDALLAKYNADLPALSEFILPAGSRAASLAHVCRTVCRRAERSIVALANAEPLHEHPRQYVNRLSDLLFVLSRVLNRFAGGSDVQFRYDRMPRHRWRLDGGLLQQF